MMARAHNTPVVSNWGIPDWRDPSAYGDTGRWSEFRWRWEFIRRRDDCRKDFLAHKDETVRFFEEVHAHRRTPDGKRLLRPDEPGFVAQVPGCYEKYGLINLPNPAIGDQPFYIIMFRTRGPRLLMWTEDGIKTRFSETTDAVMVFDLTAPIGAQVKGARELLEWRQKDKLGHVVEPGKKHSTKWFSYLRVLDAKESGASLSQIAKSGVLVGRREDPQSARDVWNAANALRFKWPR
jgi:hypothetical protein